MLDKVKVVVSQQRIEEYITTPEMGAKLGLSVENGANPKFTSSYEALGK